MFQPLGGGGGASSGDNCGGDFGSVTDGGWRSTFCNRKKRGGKPPSTKTRAEVGLRARRGALSVTAPATFATPLCDIPSDCSFFTGPWTVTRSSLRMLRRVAAFCRPLRPVLRLVSFHWGTRTAGHRHCGGKRTEQSAVRGGAGPPGLQGPLGLGLRVDPQDLHGLEIEGADPLHEGGLEALLQHVPLLLLHRQRVLEGQVLWRGGGGRRGVRGRPGGGARCEGGGATGGGVGLGDGGRGGGASRCPPPKGSV